MIYYVKGMIMKIEGVVVFVMGVNCGLGFEFVK